MRARAHLGKVELERVVGAEADVEAGAEEGRERVALVGEEEGVVRERRHGDLQVRLEGQPALERCRRSRNERTHTDLLEVEEVLEGGHLAQEDAVRDRVRGEEGRREVVRVAGLAGVRAQPERVCGSDTVSSGCGRRRGRRSRGALKPRSCRQLLSEVMLAYRK